MLKKLPESSESMVRFQVTIRPINYILNAPSKNIDVFSTEKYGETRRKVKRFQH
jgi:hypothetical protein